MKTWTLALLALLAIGCGNSGSRVASRVPVVSTQKGPEVDITVRPVMSGDASGSAAQRFKDPQPLEIVSEPAAQAPPVAVIPARPATTSEPVRQSQDDKVRSTPRKRRADQVRRPRNSEEASAPAKDAAPKSNPTREKSFEELSPQERKRLIEGG